MSCQRSPGVKAANDRSSPTLRGRLTTCGAITLTLSLEGVPYLDAWVPPTPTSPSMLTGLKKCNNGNTLQNLSREIECKHKETPSHVLSPDFGAEMASYVIRILL